jgi:ATP synthase protein I
VAGRGSLAVAGLTAVVAIGALFAAGPRTALGAVIGGALVVAFFGSDSLTSVLMRGSDPSMVLAVAVSSYFTKITMLGVLLLAFRDTTVFSIEALGVMILAGTVVWLGLSLVLLGRGRILYAAAPAVRGRS